MTDDTYIDDNRITDLPTTPDELKRLTTRAENGDADALFLMSTLYLDGGIVPKDNSQMKVWLNKAALAGSVNAQINLGSFYYKGMNGYPVDEKQALYWYQMAANRGDNLGEYDCAQMYQHGIGTQVDLVMAFRYAAANSWPPNSRSKALIAELKSQTSHEQQAEALRLLILWQMSERRITK